MIDVAASVVVWLVFGLWIMVVVTWLLYRWVRS